MKRVIRKRGFNKNNKLTESDKLLFSKVCELTTYATGSIIEAHRKDGNACFYIVLKGMVREFSKKEDVEQTRTFYFENEFFGWNYDKIADEQIYYQALEPVVMYRICRAEWEALQLLSPAIKRFWYELLENQIMNVVQWQDVFNRMSASDLFSLLHRQKPALWKQNRLYVVITSLSQV